MTQTTPTIVGQFAIVHPSYLVSRTGSSVPWAEPAGDEVLGTIVDAGEYAYAVMDDGGAPLARIYGVYHLEDGWEPNQWYVSGWIDGQWGRWLVTT